VCVCVCARKRGAFYHHPWVFGPERERQGEREERSSNLNVNPKTGGIDQSLRRHTGLCTSGNIPGSELNRTKPSTSKS
jgi:hypothetical protein